MQTAPVVTAGPLRRIAAAIYDGLLLLALLMVTTGVLQVLSGGEAITRASAGPWEYAYRTLLAAMVVAYFGIAWTRRGETLGMKAWRIRLERDTGGLLGWPGVVRRLAWVAPVWLLAIGGVLAYTARLAGPVVLAAAFLPLVANYAWLWLGRGAAPLDRGSRTRIVLLPPRS